MTDRPTEASTHRVSWKPRDGGGAWRSRWFDAAGPAKSFLGAVRGDVDDPDVDAYATRIRREG